MKSKEPQTPQLGAMPMDEYQLDPCERPSLSASMIHLLCSQSPRHAWQSHPKLNPQYKAEEAEQMDIGTIAHSILLEGVDIAAVLDFPDWRKDIAKAARDEARAAGKVPVLRHKWDNVLAMIAAARVQLDQHKDARLAFKNGKPEQVILWEEEGVCCRARPDWLMNDHSAIWDYKTTGASANPEIVSRTLFNSGYDIQAAWYLRALTQLHAITHTEFPANRLPQFRFVYQETYPPYALSVVALGPGSMMLAEKKIMFAMDLWKRCLETNDWPGYPNRTCYATLPKWHEEMWLEKETADL